MMAHRLKQRRLAAGFSQRQLGLAVGIEPETAKQRISKYENGDVSPPFKLVCRLAIVLDVPESYFYAVDEEFAAKILQLYRDEQHPAGD